MTFETLQSDLKFEGRVFSVRSDLVRLPDAQTTRLDVVIHGGAVVIVPVDADGNLWFVRQYRYPAGSELVEFPAGSVEEEEDLLEGAQRELREEVGFAAGALEKIGGFFLAPGYSTEYLHIFLARDLSYAPLKGDIDEFVQTEKYTPAEALAMAQNGSLRDAKTLAALLLARPYLHL
ncbi:MAG TPA: NUDIX hydrolase [Anaerolineales bacterium]|nr:NUDIX hydrolase [Anaerolineales bacterium]